MGDCMLATGFYLCVFTYRNKNENSVYFLNIPKDYNKCECQLNT